MAQIRVQFDGRAEAIDAIERIKLLLLAVTPDATKAAGDFLQKTARSNFVGSHPPGFPHMAFGGDRPNTATGNLQQSITVLPVVAEGPARYSVTVGPTIVYARIIELGGTITPKESEYLSWFSPWLGRRIYRKSVHLDGWPYFRPAYETTVGAMNSIFEEYWGAALNG